MAYSLTAEAVSQGHPDKIADQISDAVLDACLVQDIYSKVACETLLTDGLVFLGGELSTKAQLDIRKIVRNTLQDIGYNDSSYGFDASSCGIVFSLHQQSEELVKIQDKQVIPAGDQGIMYGYACDETAELMPLPILFAHQILNALKARRISNHLPYLRPDAKSQVTVEYKDSKPQRISVIVISTQHAADVDLNLLRADLKQMILDIAPAGMIDDQTQMLINPGGAFVIGGPRADTGLTGRKIMVDSYGGIGRHGGGAFSGKDPTKVDRSGAYMARYVAKNVVAAKLAKSCEFQIAYAIGIAQPIATHLNTFGTGVDSDENLHAKILKQIDLTPSGIIQKLDLRRPIYQKTASGGHFGRLDPDFTWEALDLPLSY